MRCIVLARSKGARLLEGDVGDCMVGVVIVSTMVLMVERSRKCLAPRVDFFDFSSFEFVTVILPNGFARKVLSRVGPVEIEGL